MTALINASTSSGVVVTSDTSGSLAFQSNGTTIMTVASTGVSTQVGAPAFSAYKSGSNQTTSTGWNKVSFQTEEFDTNNNYDNATNYRFTPTVAGYYQCSASIGLTGATTAEMLIAIYKNGVEWKRGTDTNSSTFGETVSTLINFNGSTDYIEVYVYTGTSVAIQASQSSSWFSASMVRSA